MFLNCFDQTKIKLTKQNKKFNPFKIEVLIFKLRNGLS
jgi:hypothetical protein